MSVAIILEAADLHNTLAYICKITESDHHVTLNNLNEFLKLQKPVMVGASIDFIMKTMYEDLDGLSYDMCIIPTERKVLFISQPLVIESLSDDEVVTQISDVFKTRPPVGIN